jgi:hypothetical protein
VRLSDAAMPKAPSYGHSSSWGDYDNDGNLDLFVTSGNPVGGTNMLYRNNGNGTFSWTNTAMSREPFSQGFHGSILGDYDNDGYLDVVIFGHDGQNRLFHNNGGGSFTRITNGVFVDEVPTPSPGRSWTTIMMET